MVRCKSERSGLSAKSILDAVDAMPKQDASTLILNVGKLLGYLQLNERYLVPYAARYSAGLAISSATAESAVNELVSTRMAKRQRIRWSEQGAHLLVQVRAAVLNGTLRPREKPVTWSGNAGHERCNAHSEWELEAA